MGNPYHGTLWTIAIVLAVSAAVIDAAIFIIVKAFGG